MAGFFRKISPATARLHTLAQRHLRGAAWTAGGRGWRWEPGGAPARAGAVLYGALGAAEISVWLDDWNLVAAGALEIPPEMAERLPEPLRLAALEVFADDGLAALEKAAGMPATLVRLEPGAAAPPASSCGFRWVRDDGLAVEGAWSAAPRDEAWEPAVRRALAGRPVAAGGLPGDLPLAGTVRLGAWAWPAAELAWAAGDVLLPPGLDGEPAGRILVVGGALRFAATWRAGVLRVEGKTMTAAAEPEAKAPAEAAETPVESVEVELVAEVGRLTVTLADLRRLGAGEVVEFSTPVERPVALTVGGRWIADGELVDVGGRVGVRIVSATNKEG